MPNASDEVENVVIPLLMTKSRHAPVRTLGENARPGTEALAAWQRQTDSTRWGRD